MVKTDGRLAKKFWQAVSIGLTYVLVVNLFIAAASGKAPGEAEIKYSISCSCPNITKEGDRPHTSLEYHAVCLAASFQPARLARAASDGAGALQGRRDNSQGRAKLRPRSISAIQMAVAGNYLEKTSLNRWRVLLAQAFRLGVSRA